MVLAIDLGATHVRLAITDLDGAVLLQRKGR
jgi:predicted NBD/HSP70 family sugar kinase